MGAPSDLYEHLADGPGSVLAGHIASFVGLLFMASGLWDKAQAGRSPDAPAFPRFSTRHTGPVSRRLFPSFCSTKSRHQTSPVAVGCRVSRCDYNSISRRDFGWQDCNTTTKTNAARSYRRSGTGNRVRLSKAGKSLAVSYRSRPQAADRHSLAGRRLPAGGCRAAPSRSYSAES